MRKYECMPDEFYHDSDRYIDINGIGIPKTMQQLGLTLGRPTQLWEHMAGSCRLSAVARNHQMLHLPLLDFRWGANLGRIRHHVPILWAFLV